MTIRQMSASVFDRLPTAIDARVTAAATTATAPLVHVLAAWRGIHLGVGCRFFGVPILRRFPNSHIAVGRRCTFRSSKRSNLCGINRPCYICTIHPESLISIGEECGFSATVISAALSISIGSRVLCGANTTITDTDWHALAPEGRAEASAAMAPVVIEDDVWLGTDVIVLKGVTIGRNTVVAAGSIVVKSLPPNVLAAGRPAKVLRTL